MAVIKAI